MSISYKLIPVFLILFSLEAIAQEERLLYPGKIPNSKEVMDPETMVDRGATGRIFRNTAIPTLTIFTPPSPNGKAVVICPGGAYAITAFDKEGTRVAEALLEDSITSFVLKYRIPQDLTNEDRSLAPLQDAQQAIRYVRQNAENYGLDPWSIGIMGFSAGGHLASSVATHFDKLAENGVSDTTSVRPDFAILIYPVISFTEELTHMGSRNNLIGEDPSKELIEHWSSEMNVTPDSPPAFLVHAGDDGAVPVGNSLAYYKACLENEVPAEMHIYPNGGHGFGLNNTTTRDYWIDRLKNWLKGI